MIKVSDYLAVDLPDAGIKRLVEPGAPIDVTPTPLPSIKKVKFEIEAFTEEGKPPVTQQFFFKEKLRHVYPNRKGHSLPEGVILALKYARRNEDAWFQISPERQNNASIGNYPKEDGDIFVRIKVLEIGWSQVVNPEEPVTFLRAAEISKDSGNEEFLKENHHKAVQEYAKALGFLTNLPKKLKERAEETAESREFWKGHDRLKVDVLNNLSLTHLRLGQFQDALQRATEALAVDEHNLKARYRIAKVREAEKDYQEAIELFEALEMSHKAQQLKQLLKEQHKKIARKMKDAFR